MRKYRKYGADWCVDVDLSTYEAKFMVTNALPELFGSDVFELTFSLNDFIKQYEIKNTMAVAFQEAIYSCDTFKSIRHMIHSDAFIVVQMIVAKTKGVLQELTTDFSLTDNIHIEGTINDNSHLKSLGYVANWYIDANLTTRTAKFSATGSTELFNSGSFELTFSFPDKV